MEERLKECPFCGNNSEVIGESAFYGEQEVQDDVRCKTCFDGIDGIIKKSVWNSAWAHKQIEQASRRAEVYREIAIHYKQSFLESEDKANEKQPILMSVDEEAARMLKEKEGVNGKAWVN